MAKKKNGKFGRHSTLSKEVKKVVRKLVKLDGVTKLELNRFHPVRHSRANGEVVLKEEHQTGMKLMVYHSDGIQDIYLVVEEELISDVAEYIAAMYL